MKLSTETLLEQVQNVVLKSDELIKPQKNHMQRQVLELLANPVSAEKKIKVSRFKTVQILNFVDWNLDEEMQPLALEKKLILIQRSIIQRYNFSQLSPIKVSKKKTNGEYWLILIHSTIQKQSCWLRHLRKKSCQLLWEKPSLNIRKNFTNIKFLTILVHQVFTTKTRMHWLTTFS